MATGTLEQLAARAGCAPEIRAGAEELRQARCATEDGTYTLVTFATDRGQREWINAANDYGGTYLLGRRWVVAGGEGTITALRARLGGELERGADHGSGTVRPGPGEGHSSPGSPGSHGVHGGHGG
nr:lipoprotein [Streptomyces tsukubensis NRRL18488]